MNDARKPPPEAIDEVVPLGVIAALFAVSLLGVFVPGYLGLPNTETNLGWAVAIIVVAIRCALTIYIALRYGITAAYEMPLHRSSAPPPRKLHELIPPPLFINTLGLFFIATTYLLPGNILERIGWSILISTFGTQGIFWLYLRLRFGKETARAMVWL